MLVPCLCQFALIISYEIRLEKTKEYAMGKLVSIKLLSFKQIYYFDVLDNFTMFIATLFKAWKSIFLCHPQFITKPFIKPKFDWTNNDNKWRFYCTLNIYAFNNSLLIQNVFKNKDGSSHSSNINSLRVYRSSHTSRYRWM